MRTVIFYSVLILLITGCSTSSKKDTSSDEAYDEYEIADAPGTKPEKEPKLHTIEISQMKFVPDVLNVRKGDKVVWLNKDIVDHDIMEKNSKAWASAKLPSGASWSMIVTKSELYFCNLHVVMQGKLIVDGQDISMLNLDSGITMCKQ